MEVGVVLLHDNRPGRVPYDGDQFVEIPRWVGARPGLACAVCGCRARPERAVAESQVCWNRTHQMEQHQEGSQEAGKNGHRSLRERPLQLSIQSQSPNRVPTGKAITTSWLITNWRTSGSIRQYGVEFWATMTNPSWIVLAWLVVALASALKFWSITRPYRNKAAGSSAQTVDEARKRLEQRWRKDSKV